MAGKSGLQTRLLHQIFVSHDQCLGLNIDAGPPLQRYVNNARLRIRPTGWISGAFWRC